MFDNIPLFYFEAVVSVYVLTVNVIYINVIVNEKTFYVDQSINDLLII